MQLVVRRLLLFLSLSRFSSSHESPFSFLFSECPADAPSATLFFPLLDHPPLSLCRFPFSTTCGGGPRHNIPLFAPSLYPSSPFPLVMIATLRCTRLQKLCTTGGGGGGGHPLTLSLDCYVINYYIALLQRRRVALVVSGRLSSSFLFLFIYLFCFIFTVSRRNRWGERRVSRVCGQVCLGWLGDGSSVTSFSTL